MAEYCNNQQLLEEVVSVTSNWTFTDISELMRPHESMQRLLVLIVIVVIIIIIIVDCYCYYCCCCLLKFTR